MQRTFTMAVLTVAALSLVSADALAQGWGRRGGRGHGWGPGGGWGRGMMRLGLTEAQKQQVALLRATMLEQTTETRNTLDVKRVEMRALWAAEEPDRSAILAKHAEMDVLRQELRVARVDFKLAVHALLTPEQRGRFCTGPGAGRGRGWGRGWGAGWETGPWADDS